MAKKRFGVDAVTNQALSQTMQMAKEHISKLNNTLIPIDRVVLDPENPRKHNIKRQDLDSGPANSDPEYKTKMEEYEGLCQLAASIEKEGLLHPVTVFKDQEGYKLIAGERRLFASIIGKKTQIEARVYKNKPKSFDLKLIQWMENDSRKNLSLHKKLLNVESIMEAYKLDQGHKITAQMLSGLLGISRQLAQFYLAIIANTDLMDLISDGRVSTLMVARKLASLKSKSEILKALENSATSPKNTSAKINKQTKRDVVKRAGRKREQISLGRTKHPEVARVLLEAVISEGSYSKYAKSFEKVNWSNMDQATDAFKKLLRIIENELGAN